MSISIIVIDEGMYNNIPRYIIMLRFVKSTRDILFKKKSIYGKKQT